MNTLKDIQKDAYYYSIIYNLNTIDSHSTSIKYLWGMEGKS